MMSGKDNQASLAIRLVDFAKDVYAPGMHGGFAAFWFLALAGFLMMVSGQAGPFVIDMKLMAGIATLFLVLFYLRVADEIKDYEYDKLYNPDRPLVCGNVSHRDLYLFLVGSAALVIAINLFFMTGGLLAVVIVDMLYGIFLIWLEKKSARVSDDMFLNLLVTYPVNIALSIYVCLFCINQYNIGFSVLTLVAVVVFVCAFLHHEIGRKTCWPHQVGGGKRHYSGVVGGRNSALLALGIALFSTSGVFIYLSPWTLEGVEKATGWMVLLPLVPACMGTVRFMKAEKKSRGDGADAPMTVYAMGYLFLFYVSLILHAVSVNGISISAAVVVLMASGGLMWLASKGWAKDIGRLGSLYIYSTESYISGNDMLITAELKIPAEPRKIYGSYERFIRENPFLQSKWIYDARKKRYYWGRFGKQELETRLAIEKEHILKNHSLNDLHAGYVPTNDRLPVRITPIDASTLVFSFNHVFTNGLNIFRWIEIWLSYYTGEAGDAGQAGRVSFGMGHYIRQWASLVWAVAYTASFFSKAGKNAGPDTVDLTYGRKPVACENSYSIKTYHLSEEETASVINNAKGIGATVAEYVCAGLATSFFESSPDKNRMCISAPTDLLGEVPAASMHSPGNYTGSLIFQLFRDQPVEKQVVSAFRGFRRLVPFGMAKLMNMALVNEDKLKTHFVKQAGKPVFQRAPMENYTFAFSSPGVLRFPLINKWIKSCSGHTKNQAVFICLMTLNNRMSIEVSVSNDLYEADEVFGIVDLSVGKIHSSYLRNCI